MKQRRFLLSILMLVLCISCAFAEPVTKDQAQQKAKAFLAKRGMAAKTSLNLVYQGLQRGQHKGAPAKNASYYVFNNGHDGGFVIVAGDDCAEEVLGYADNGTFDADNIPSNMQAFLDGYAEEIAAARARGARAADGGETVEVARKVVAPLIETHWNQHDPYNQLCYNNSEQQCVTGCVATALAQVMYYYKWPENNTSAIPGYTSKLGDVFGDLPAKTFKWDKMKPAYINTGEDDEEAEQAVAELMWYCGHAVKMNYGPGESGGYESMIPEALKNYFGYPGNPTWVMRNKYTAEGWDELIYHELKYGRPVLYGANTSGGAGHEFICDGYDGHGLYHINWGWGGLSDGYFRLQALRPTSQGTGGSSDYGGYSLTHDAIIGVCNTKIKNEESTPATSVLRTVELYVKGSTTIDYYPSWGLGNANVYFEYTLSGAQDGVDWGFGLYRDGELLQSVENTSNQVLGAGYTYWNEGGLLNGLGNNLEDGSYQVVGINRLNGTEEWLPNAGSDLIYIDVEISNGKATYTNVKNTQTLSIEVASVEQRFDTGSGISQVRAYVSNTGNADYSGSLVLAFNGSWMAEEGVYLPIDGVDYVDFFFPAMTGTVNLNITDASGNVLYTKNGFTLGSAPSAPSLTKVDENIKNFSSDGTKMYSALLDGFVTLKNTTSTDFDGYLTLKVKVYKYRDETYIYSTPIERLIPCSIKAGKTKTIPLSFSELTVGDKLKYELKDPAGNVLASNDKFAEIVPGVVYWKGDGRRYAVAPADISFGNDVTAISLEDFGNSFQYDIDCSNPYAISYVSSNLNSPTSNTVRNGKANAITLDGDYDFFVPKRFFANQIIYNRMMELGADGKKGWQTITLPFAVEEVTSATKGKVDWYHGNDTKEKDFWVREFKQVKGNTVQFADAEVWVPNVPYILAVPGDHWGAKYDLTGANMEFKAEKVWVEKSSVSAVVSDRYEFVGLSGGFYTPSSQEEKVEYDELMNKMKNAYILNEAGNAFVQGSPDWIEMHNLCYFTIDERTITPPARLNIGAFDETEGICMPKVTATDGQQVDVFTIDGIKVATATVSGGRIDLGRLPKGVYVVEGKKIVR